MLKAVNFDIDFIVARAWEIAAIFRDNSVNATACVRMTYKKRDVSIWNYIS